MRPSSLSVYYGRGNVWALQLALSACDLQWWLQHCLDPHRFNVYVWGCITLANRLREGSNVTIDSGILIWPTLAV